MKGLGNKRIPTIFAFVLLFISIWVTSYLIQTGVIYIGQAAPDKTPQNIRIGNVTDTSFTVAFTTNDPASSVLSVEEIGKNSFLVLDDRNKKDGQQTEFYSHYITVLDLPPQTAFNFTIIVEGDNYQDGDQKYSVRTGASINEPAFNQDPVAGKGLLPDGQPAADTIVELQTPGSQTILGLTSENGDFNIPTNSIRKADLNSYLELDPDTSLTLTLRRQDLSSTIETLFINAKPLAVFSLNKNYDFTAIDDAETSTKASELKASTPRITPGTIRILTPVKDQSFVDSRPQFRGTALPNQKVKIKIESEVIIDEVTANSSGLWTYRPPANLTPGQHKITVETIDSFGVSKILTQTFTVFASGSQIAESATPSASPTSTPTPTPTLSPQIILTPTPTPTSAPTPTIEPTAMISPTQIPNITPPPPGSTSSLILTAISAILIFTGAALLFVL